MNAGSDFRDKIFILRKKSRSYREIAATLGVSKSTVAYWLSQDPSSKKVKEVLTIKNNALSRVRIQKIISTSRRKWAAWAESARSEAKEIFPTLCKNPLFISGTMLYWGEGDSKIDNPLRFSNTDPRMVGVYVTFLKQVLCVQPEKIRMGLILYHDLDESKTKNFWQAVAGLPEENFMKTQFIKGSHPTKRLAHGICMVVVNSKQCKIKVLEWIDLFSKNLTLG